MRKVQITHWLLLLFLLCLILADKKWPYFGYFEQKYLSYYQNSQKWGKQVHRGRFHNDFIQSTRSAPLRAIRVSKEAKLYKEFKFMEFLLYFWLRIEKTLKNCPKLAKVPSKWWFWDSFFNLIQFWLKSRAKIKQIQVLYNFSLHFTPQRAQGVYS